MAGPTLGTAYVQVVASAQGMRTSLSKSLSGDASAAGSSAGALLAGKLKGALAAAGIGAALIGGFKAAINETAELQQSYIGGLDTLYGNAADKAREYAQAAAEAGISQSNYADQAVSFGAALKQAYGGDTSQALEAANKAILDMADNSAKMGTPLEEIQRAYQGFARGQFGMLDNLKLGYGGTKSEMERLLADAEKISGVHYDLNNLGDMYEAIHVVQGELGLTGVAAEEAKSTLSGSFGGMKAAWENLIGNIGLGENVESSMQGFTDAMSNYLFNNLIPTIGTIIQSLPAAIGTFIQTGAPQLMTAGMNLLKSLISGAQKNFPTLLSDLMHGLVGISEKIGPIASRFVSLGLKLIQSIAQGIIQNIPTFIQTIPRIITNFANIINNNAPKIIATGFSILKSLLAGIIKAIPVLIQNIPQILQAIVSVFMAFQWGKLGRYVMTSLLSGLKAMIGKVKTQAAKIKDGIASKIKAVPDAIRGAISKVKSLLSFSGLKAKVSTVFNNIKTAIKDKLDSAKDKVKEIIQKIKNMFPFNVGKIFKGFIKLPKVSVSKTKDGGAKTSSSTSTSHFAKAMDQPYMFGKETMFAAGEAGDEILYGRRALMNDIAEAVGGNGASIINNITVNGADDPEEWARRLVRQMRLEMRSI